VWLLPLALMSGHYRYLLIGHNRQELEFFSAVAGVIVNIGFNVLLTPVYGIQAAAWSLIVSEIIIWSLTYYFARFAIGQTQTRPLFGVAVGGSVDERS
jgi:O-antigen/teichoic acid export membrane protein